MTNSFGPILVDLDHFRPFWAVLGCFELSRAVMGHFGHFRLFPVVSNHVGLIMTILDHFRLFRAISGKFGPF
jgi:hypothetical protein